MIQPTTYRGKDGWSVTGRDHFGRRFRIFAQTKSGARQIEAAAKKAQHAVIDRLLLAGK